MEGQQTGIAFLEAIEEEGIEPEIAMFRGSHRGKGQRGGGAGQG